MKAYVIKNKDGRYFAGFDRMSLFTIEKDITDAVMYRADRYDKIELENAPEFKDCEIVEITIAEGDLDFNEKHDLKIRHQVCEEIREKLKQIELSIENSPMFIDEEYKLNLKRKAVHKNVYKILDQIEGESK